MGQPLMTLREHFRTGQGLQTFSRSTITLYDDRVECTSAGLQSGTDSIRYEQIAHVMVDRGFRWATLAIQTTGSGGIQVGGLKKDEAEAARQLIDGRIAAARSPAPAASAAPTIADQIAQLSALRDSGALSEDEFAASKARLLAN